MNLNIIFTPDEKKNFLVKNGYELIECEKPIWRQWGNHDSQGEWETIKYVCAVKDGENPDTKNEYNEIFNRLITINFKKFILDL